MIITDLPLKSDYIINHICNNTDDFRWNTVKTAREIFTQRQLDSNQKQQQIEEYQRLVDMVNTKIDQGATENEIIDILAAKDFSQMEIEDFMEFAIDKNYGEEESKSGMKIGLGVILFIIVLIIKLISWAS